MITDLMFRRREPSSFPKIISERFSRNSECGEQGTAETHGLIRLISSSVLGRLANLKGEPAQLCASGVCEFTFLLHAAGHNRSAPIMTNKDHKFARSEADRTELSSGDIPPRLPTIIRVPRCLPPGTL